MYEGQFYQTNSLFQIPPLKPGRTTIILLMPLLCGDIELNPGPGNTSIYPCGCCERIVNWSQKAVCCDDGSIWQHKTCVCMCSIDYEGIESTSWRCFKCNSVLRDFLTYHSYNSPVSNNFNTLLSNPSDSALCPHHHPRCPKDTAALRPLTTATWASSEVIQKSQKKHSPHSWREFRSYQRRTTAAIRAARMDYINDILAKSLEEKDSRPFWRYVKSQRQENRIQTAARRLKS